MEKIEKTMLERIVIGILAVAVVMMVFNVVQVNNVSSVSVIEEGSSSVSVDSSIDNSVSSTVDSSGAALLEMLNVILPTGIPEVYGSELGVSFDAVSVDTPEEANEAIKKLGFLDKQISLSGSDLERYISVAGMISCEYCCGAEAIIFSNGQAACGCAHSYAMRGLAKYLIKYHGSEYTNEEILEELGKWKTLFFPGKLAQKAIILKEQGIELTYVNLASNKYRGIETQTATSAEQTMVGGC